MSSVERHNKGMHELPGLGRHILRMKKIWPENKKPLVQESKLKLQSSYCGNTFSQAYCNNFTMLPYITTISVSENENKTLFLPDFVPCRGMDRVWPSVQLLDVH